MILTPELAARMLDVWDRRKYHPQGRRYDSTLLEAAFGAPDKQMPLPNFIRKLRTQYHGATPRRWRSDTSWLR